MMYSGKFTLHLILYSQILSVGAQSTSTVTGSQVQFNCKFKVGVQREAIMWSRIYPQGKVELSFNDTIFTIVPSELRERLNITGVHVNGEINLMISDIKKTDEGQWVCEVYGQPSKQQTHQLFVIVVPTSIEILNKQNKLLKGTEGLNLPIKCLAKDGDPAPDMTLTIGGEVFEANSQYTIDHTIASINRSYDGLNVTCQAGYIGITYTPKTDTANIRLNLKPFPPSLNMNPVVTENTKSLVLTCRSTGSRPAPTKRMWLIGNSNIDITSSSTPLSSSPQSDGTYTVTSTLTYKVSKIYNQQNMTCGFKNIATGDEHVKVSSRMNVQYAPVVSVHNITFSLTNATREIVCDVNSNPTTSFTKWQHRSKYGEPIREFSGNKTLVLPQQTEEERYQDTGEYVCTVTNGIKDEEGKLYQTGSGYVNCTAPPRFLNDPSQVKLGQYGKEVNIEVSVYSVPKYSTTTWLKNGSALPRSSKYKTSEVSDVIRDTFYSKDVQLDGYRFLLSIYNLEKTDFVNYTLRLNNGVGQTVDHIVVLMSASPPKTPTNFSVTDETESTVVLHWMPSFDGGHDQWFIVQYRSRDTQTWKETNIPVLLQLTDNDLNSFTLPGLMGGTSYEIRMYAQNKFNKSAPTDTKNIATKVAESSSLGAIIGGVSGVLVIVAALSIVAFIIFKKKRDGNEAKMISRSEEEFEDGGHYITLRQNRTTASTFQRDLEHVYDDIDSAAVDNVQLRTYDTVYSNNVGDGSEENGPDKSYQDLYDSLEEIHYYEPIEKVNIEESSNAVGTG